MDFIRSQDEARCVWYSTTGYRRFFSLNTRRFLAMMRGGYAPLTVPAQVWHQPEVLDVLARRDVGHLFRIIQNACDATQTQIGVATGLSQAQVSEIISGRRKVVSVDVLSRIVTGLRMTDPARMTLMMGRKQPSPEEDPPGDLDNSAPQNLADVVAVFPTRSAFASTMPVHTLFDGATEIRAAGLSLNLLCQQYSDGGLCRLVNNGTHVQCLILDPHGDAITNREREEGFVRGHLSALNEVNLGVLRRARDHLPRDKRANLAVAIYDATIRFNIILIDERLCIVQPYLPHSRGIDSPTFVIERQPDRPGLYATFEDIYTSIEKDSQPL